MRFYRYDMALKQTLELAAIGGFLVLLLVHGVINVLWPRSQVRGRMNTFEIQLLGIMYVFNALLAFYLILLPFLGRIQR